MKRPFYLHLCKGHDTDGGPNVSTYLIVRREQSYAADTRYNGWIGQPTKIRPLKNSERLDTLDMEVLARKGTVDAPRDWRF